MHSIEENLECHLYLSLIHLNNKLIGLNMSLPRKAVPIFPFESVREYPIISFISYAPINKAYFKM